MTDNKDFPCKLCDDANVAANEFMCHGCHEIQERNEEFTEEMALKEQQELQGYTVPKEKSISLCDGCYGHFLSGVKMTDSNDLIDQLNVKLEDAYLVCEALSEVCKALDQLIDNTKDNEMKQYLIIECGKAMDKHYEQMKGI